MEMFKWTCFTLISFYILFTCNVSAQSTPDDTCQKVFCGKGTCHLSSTEILGFRCDCDSGWNKFNLGPFNLPPCVIPNCTTDFNCDNGSLKAPPFPPPNVSNPCLLNLCGDGSCVANGFDFKCQCNEGSANLLNDPKMICIKKCTLAADCNDLELGFGSPSTETPPSTQDSGPGSPKTGSGEMLKCSRDFVLLTLMVLEVIFQNWI